MSKRKIAVITTTRAEYGLLRPLLHQIQDDKELELQLVVTGTHLLEAFGYTLKEIEEEFAVDKKIVMDMKHDDRASLSHTMAQLQKDITDTFVELSPDIVVILGDRYEMLSVASASLMLQIPIAHIHGGEITEGAIDDSIRHAITKLSHLHFACTQEYANRIVQMGEEPNRVFNVGALGVENVKRLRLLSKEEFEKSIDFKLHKRNILVTYHPQTLSKLSAQKQIQELFTAFDTLDNTAIIFTKANADEGGRVINAMIDEYVKNNSAKAVAFESLGQLRYFSAISYIDAVVGNSSSGILEVPSFQKPTVNIGDRQKGRVEAQSILNCKLESQDIIKALEQVYDENFQKLLQNVTSPYESENTSEKIKEIIKKSSLETIFYKSFYDIKGIRDE